MQKPHLGSITFTNTYINILHTTATQRGSGRAPQKDGWLQFSPHRRLAEQLLFLLIVPGMGIDFFFFQSPRLPPFLVSVLVCPVWRSAIGGFGSLRLLLHGAWLIALARSTLPILLKVVMQHLGMRLLMCRQDMQERGWSITWGSTRVQWPSGSKSRWQAERRRCASMESLLVKRLSLVID